MILSELVVREYETIPMIMANTSENTMKIKK